jgi:hypothetical protein
VQPSSLIFIVLLGVWAAYFVLYWVRRREHLATARTADEFSASMRVLERRSPMAYADLGPRSYAASPTRAVPGGVREESPRADAEARGAAPLVAVMRPSRRVRGLTLLVGLASTVVAAPLAVLGLLPWPAVLAPLAVAVAGFGWLRAGVQAQVRARRIAAESRRMPRPMVASVAAAEIDGRAEDVVEAVSEPVETPVAEAAPEPVATEPEPARLLVDEDDIPLTWNPVPVPRPTYAMKAKAERPAPPPAETTPTPEPVTLEETAYAAQERRVAGA